MLIRKTVAKGIRIGMDLMLYDYRHWLEYEILPAGATTTRLVSSFTSLKQRTSSSRLNPGTDPAVSRSTLHIDDTVPAHPPGGATARQRPGCASNASVQPPTQTTRWMPMLQRAANTEPMPSSACLPVAGPWPRPTVGPLDFRLAVLTLQTESSRRSTTTGEKCHPRLLHCPAV